MISESCLHEMLQGIFTVITAFISVLIAGCIASKSYCRQKRWQIKFENYELVLNALFDFEESERKFYEQAMEEEIASQHEEECITKVDTKYISRHQSALRTSRKVFVVHGIMLGNQAEVILSTLMSRLNEIELNFVHDDTLLAYKESMEEIGVAIKGMQEFGKAAFRI